jgi:ATPase subunit of ABC transporter with duplicated ATPase domains
MVEVSRQSVETITRQVVSTWDDLDADVREYLLQILTERDSYEDSESLQAIILPFVNDDDEQVSLLIHKLQNFVTIPSEDTNNPQQDHSIDPAPLLPNRITLGEEEEHNIAKDYDLPSLATKVSSSNITVEQEEVPKKDRRSKRQERLEKKRNVKKETNQHTPTSIDETTEDDANAWQQTLSEGRAWGGRGFGGRGEYAGKVNTIKSNIHLSNVTISLPNGAELLQSTTMDITAHHRYALIGRNGVGKSTLLDRLAQRRIPGMPEMRILKVQQQVEASSKTPLEVLLEADIDRTELMARREELERKLELGDVTESEIEQIAEQLSDCEAGLDAIGANTADIRANDILKGLQFTKEMLEGPTESLSGGWRMRLALAQALFVPCDLLLLDECTNHLDLHGLDWLTQYLTRDNDRTMIIVSHDRSFLDAVCTDVIRMDHMRLSYFVGNYSEYERQMAEKAARSAQILDAAERQRAKAEAFVQKQQAMANKKSADPNKQRQAKTIKTKKLDRIGNYREDGKRYKNFSLKQMDEKSLRLAEKVHIEVDEPVITMNFPTPTWPPGIGPGDAIVRMEDFSFAYNEEQQILNDVTLELRRGSKVALVGKNGAGKSTLVKLISGDLSAESFHTSGSLWRHSNIRVGHVSQYTVEELQEYEAMTVVEYAESKIRYGKASSQIVAKASGNIRQYLGAFGLGGRHALQRIGKLSGGERMRLCFATVLADECHLLLLEYVMCTIVYCDTYI